MEYVIFALIWMFGTRILISEAVVIPVIYLIIWYLNKSGRHIKIKLRWVLLVGFWIGIVVSWITWECLGRGI